MNSELKGQGEYRGDFSRDTHNPLKRFSRVLMQQGRVLLDADWNEQTSILLHYLRSLATDLIGEHGGPGDGFKIVENPANTSDFIISEGHYYVNGFLCENRKPKNAKGKAMDITYFTQPDYPLDTEKNKLPSGKGLVVYLDVWERHVTSIQDEDKDHDDPSIREVALDGPDTASRSQVIWQVKIKESDITAKDAKGNYADFLAELGELTCPGTGHMQARARKPGIDGGDDCACVTSPESRYRGVENQLYRVEIHTPGVAWNGEINKETGKPAGNVIKAATFKWSRENASVIFPIRQPVVSGDGVTVVTLEHLGRDARYSLTEGDWVEIVDDDYILQNRAGGLLRVTVIDSERGSVTLEGAPTSTVGQDTTKHPLLRRWEHRSGDPKTGGLSIHSDGAALLREGSGDSGWLNLENGVQIRFQSQKPQATYAPGDYWLIPARVATGDVEWPGPVDNPASLAPHGIQHYYAPLWIVTVGAGEKVTAATGNDCRRKFEQLWK